MPNVNGKRFAYTKEGIKKAAQAQTQKKAVAKMANKKKKPRLSAR
mgnify:CR=1 FL=1